MLSILMAALNEASNIPLNQTCAKSCAGWLATHYKHGEGS